MRRLTSILCALILAATFPAQADPIDVTYEIGPYATGGYSASWLHTASGCTGTGPDSGDTLYMCGYATPVTGELSGTLDAGIFYIDSGHLTVFGTTFGVGPSSRLGGDFTDSAGDLLWVLDVYGFGPFYFESIDMGTGGPNSLDENEFVLWGQNYDAYHCDDYTDTDRPKYDCMPLGVDLYGKRVPVPEPGTMALLVVGLLAMTVAGRRRRQVARNRSR